MIACLLVVAGLVILSPINAANPTERFILKVGDLEREFLIYVPETLKADAAPPLVFVFHGGNSTAKGVMKLSQFNQVADRAGAIVVYPQGVGGNWNDGRINTVSQAYREKVDDLTFFDQLLAELSRKHTVDLKRIYLTGISNGGIFAHYVAANRSEKVAAIAPVVGGMAESVAENFQPTEPVSVLVIQGTEDPLMPYEGGKVAGGSAKDRGSIVSTDKAVQLWVSANGCTSVPEKATLPDKDPSDGCATQTMTWRGGKNESLVVLYRVEGGGHTWPGGAQYLPKFIVGKVTQDFDSQTIWQFFESNPKR
ncbi:extracellular catalytic domain type 1 short-chain-length polyhydroxyalkanoate depolymerase [Planctomycetaceae bacterium SH139]